MSDPKKVTAADLVLAVQRVVEEFSKLVIAADASEKTAARAEEEARQARYAATQDAELVTKNRAMLARLIAAKIDRNGICYTEDDANGRRIEISTALIWPAHNPGV
jgi:hypothetical protein